MTDAPMPPFTPQATPLWLAEPTSTGVFGGRVLGWLPARGDHRALALVARVDADGGTRATYERPIGAVEVFFGDTREEAFRAAARSRDTAADPCALMDAALHTVWLEGNWEWVTRKMTAEEREAAADAVFRHHDRIDDEPLSEDSVRWWR